MAILRIYRYQNFLRLASLGANKNFLDQSGGWKWREKFDNHFMDLDFLRLASGYFDLQNL